MRVNLPKPVFFAGEHRCFVFKFVDLCYFFLYISSFPGRTRVRDDQACILLIILELPSSFKTEFVQLVQFAAKLLFRPRLGPLSPSYRGWRNGQAGLSHPTHEIFSTLQQPGFERQTVTLRESQNLLFKQHLPIFLLALDNVLKCVFRGFALRLEVFFLPGVLSFYFISTHLACFFIFGLGFVSGIYFGLSFCLGFDGLRLSCVAVNVDLSFDVFVRRRRQQRGRCFSALCNCNGDDDLHEDEEGDDRATDFHFVRHFLRFFLFLFILDEWLRQQGAVVLGAVVKGALVLDALFLCSWLSRHSWRTRTRRTRNKRRSSRRRRRRIGIGLKDVVPN